MTFAPERQPMSPNAKEENPKKKTPENTIETAELMPKSLRALVAVSGALLWGEWNFLNQYGPLDIGTLTKEDEEKIEKQGWIKTMAEKAQGYYQTMGKLEDIIDAASKDEWDKILGKSPEQKQEKTA